MAAQILPLTIAPSSFMQTPFIGTVLLLGELRGSLEEHSIHVWSSALDFPGLPWRMFLKLALDFPGELHGVRICQLLGRPVRPALLNLRRNFCQWPCRGNGLADPPAVPRKGAPCHGNVFGHWFAWACPPPSRPVGAFLSLLRRRDDGPNINLQRSRGFLGSSLETLHGAERARGGARGAAERPRELRRALKALLSRI